MSKCFLIIFFCILTSVLSLSAQGNRQALEDQRARLLREISETSDLLASTQENKAKNLDRYFTLQTQITKREELISTIEAEVAQVDSSLQRSQEVVDALAADLERLEVEYSELLRAAYRQKRQQSWVQFMFGAKGLNDAYRRWQYLQQYEAYRREQAELVKSTQVTLQAKVDQLEGRRTEKLALLEQQQDQKNQLAQERTAKDVLIANLKKDEKRLGSTLKKQQADHQRLNDAIEKVIREEMAAARRRARTESALTDAGAAPRAEALDNDFANNKGRLPWPVSGGVVTKPFGKQAHPTSPGIQIENNGIDIETRSRSMVYAVFGGKVVGTQYIPGYKNIVIVQHGTYYTVYSNLDELFVSRDDTIEATQKLGRLSSADPTLHFEVWKEKQRLNPVYWVQRR
ncbi:MAG: peptidoglycan DD-metalloendopeptidase family protein [Bacteroidota bacterium]